jgi:hypothetical protein
MFALWFAYSLISVFRWSGFFSGTFDTLSVR